MDGKSIEWVRYVIDYSSRTGGGVQIPVADLDGDGDPDFVVSGKTGLYLFENLSLNPADRRNDLNTRRCWPHW